MSTTSKIAICGRLIFAYLVGCSHPKPQSPKALIQHKLHTNTNAPSKPCQSHQVSDQFLEDLFFLLSLCALSCHHFVHPHRDPSLEQMMPWLSSATPSSSFFNDRKLSVFSAIGISSILFTVLFLVRVSTPCWGYSRGRRRGRSRHRRRRWAYFCPRRLCALGESGSVSASTREQGQDPRQHAEHRDFPRYA